MPPGTVRRGRLIERLARRTPLTVLRAPAGFGKTVAVAQWLSDPSDAAEPAVWLRAESSLNASSFWTELASLLVEAGFDVRPARRPAHRAIEAALRTSDEPTTVVIDGFDELADPAIERQLIDLARFCPQLSLVVCLRSSRHFPNSIRVGISTTLIESGELAFTTAEIAALMAASASRRSPDQAGAIHRCTGGWPEPTQSVLLALQDDPHEEVAAAASAVAREFLTSRVLSTFPSDRWIQFAMATSVPEILTDTIAEEVSGDTSASHRLAWLESAGLLTSSVYHGGPVHRWPDAARRVLQEEFARRNPGRMLELHARLARIYLSNDEPGPALSHALHAGDTDMLVRLIEEFWPRLMHENIATLDAALAALPLELILKSPRATAARDIRMHVLGEVVDSALLTLPDPLPSDPSELVRLAHSENAYTALQTAKSMMIAMRMRGRGRRALDYAQRTETIGKDAAATLPAVVSPTLPAVILQAGITRLMFDDLPGAESACRRAYQGSARHTSGYIHRDAAGKLALLRAFQGDAAQAERWLDRHRSATSQEGTLTPQVDRSGLLAQAFLSIDRLDAVGLAQVLPMIETDRFEEHNWSPFMSYLRARDALVWGDRRGALRQLEDDMERLATWLGPGSTMAPVLAATRVDLLLSLGLGGLARASLEGNEHPALQPAAARLALLTDDDPAALRIATTHQSSHRPGARGELSLVAAIARYRQGDLAGAADSLTQAVRTTQASGALFAFIMVPRDELRELAGAVPEALALLDSEPLRSTMCPFATKVALIALTDRERRVLDRIAEGRTIQEMAKDLFVSNNTIKSQVRSLYAKLGANSRETALISAAEHGLLPNRAARSPRHRMARQPQPATIELADPEQMTAPLG